MNDAVQTRTWRRFTPAQRLARFTAYLAIVAAVVVSIRTIEVIPEFLSDAPEQIADLLSRMWPIDFAFGPNVGGEAIRLAGPDRQPGLREFNRPPGRDGHVGTPGPVERSGPLD